MKDRKPNIGSNPTGRNRNGSASQERKRSQRERGREEMRKRGEDNK